MATTASSSSETEDLFCNRTYRVKNVPGYFEINSFHGYLANFSVDGYAFGPEQNIKVYALVSTLHTRDDPMPVNTQVATVSFKRTPLKFRNDRTSWTLPTKNMGLQLDLIFDVEFYGFTPLNSVDNRLHNVEFVPKPRP
jgi:hypothetical protein